MIKYEKVVLTIDGIECKTISRIVNSQALEWISILYYVTTIRLQRTRVFVEWCSLDKAAFIIPFVLQIRVVDDSASLRSTLRPVQQPSWQREIVQAKRPWKISQHLSKGSLQKIEQVFSLDSCKVLSPSQVCPGQQTKRRGSSYKQGFVELWSWLPILPTRCYTCIPALKLHKPSEASMYSASCVDRLVFNCVDKGCWNKMSSVGAWYQEGLPWYNLANSPMCYLNDKQIHFRQVHHKIIHQSWKCVTIVQLKPTCSETVYLCGRCLTDLDSFNTVRTR